VAHPVPEQHSLRRLFRTLTERSFLEQLGWPNWLVVEYVSDLLAEFVHRDRLYAVEDASGRPLIELIELLQETEHRARRESSARECDVHRQIGDYTLFMTGLFPEGVHRLRRVIGGHADALLDYCKVGKRSYRIVAETGGAAGVDGAPEPPPGRVFELLSSHFELFVLGLGHVQQELQRLQDPRYERARRLLLN
jgi:hypothetical protein